MRTKDDILHHGELEAQQRFGASDAWPAAALDRMIQTQLDGVIAQFIEQLAFFFIATADDQGRCDCSFRGSEPGPDGQFQPAVKVFDASTLYFPDYKGNKLYNSIGNMLVNPHIGMLFIDFARALRVRVNGRAEVVEPGDVTADVDTLRRIWPTAQRWIRVTVEQSYGNCSKRIQESFMATYGS